MNKHKAIAGALLISSSFLLHSCGTNGSAANNQKDSVVLDDASADNTAENPFIKEYPKVPEYIPIFLKAGPVGEKTYTELKGRYSADLGALKKTVEATGAKFVLLVITPGAVKDMTVEEKAGIDFLNSAAKANGVETIDITPFIHNYTAQELTQIPKDGHWSKDGAAKIADELAKYLPKYAAAKATATYDKRPETFNDLEANMDQVLDGGKNLPYHVVTNKQGLRMNYDLAFPKTKQRILFMGDSEVYCPFLDNEYIITSLLQNKFADKEIINASVIGYTLEDYISLYNDKTKFSEPDVVIVATSPGDVIDYYFSQRNKLSRTHKQYPPSETEKELYKVLYTK